MRVLLADDQPQVRSALRLLLEQESDIQVVDEVSNVEELLVRTETSVPDVLLLDWELPGLPAPGLLTALRQGHPCLRIIALSGKWGARRSALAAGADAFVSKAEPSERLLRTLRDVRRREDKRYNTIS
jgi:DNA-binding NarL/FixJ family response regulator